jgi:hypothetical protein
MRFINAFTPMIVLVETGMRGSQIYQILMNGIPFPMARLLYHLCPEPFALSCFSQLNQGSRPSFLSRGRSALQLRL